MNLYIITTKNRRGEIDTFPMAAANDKDIHDRLNRLIKQIQEHLDEGRWIESYTLTNPIDYFKKLLNK